ncbi:MAG: TetR family transcriptional regulator [Steroidobacteraceae bacterium]
MGCLKVVENTAVSASGGAGVRARILQTARDLFYREGLRAIGVDRIVAESGVAKTSLYRWFPSKDDLIAAFLVEEERERWESWDRNAARFSAASPLEELRGIFIGLERQIASSTFRGCPFLNAVTELPDPAHPARAVCERATMELRTRLLELVTSIGVRNPQQVSDQLTLLVEGAFASGQLIGKQGPVTQLRVMAELLVRSQMNVVPLARQDSLETA